MKRPMDFSSPPRNGIGVWVYENIEDGTRLQHPYHHILKWKAEEYRRANNYPIGTNWENDFDDNICQHTTGNVCQDWTPPTLAEMASSVTQALWKWAQSGFQVRTTGEVQAVMEICKACPNYGGERGMLKVVCRLCGCSRLKIFLLSSRCPINKW